MVIDNTYFLHLFFLNWTSLIWFYVKWEQAVYEVYISCYSLTLDFLMVNWQIEPPDV